MRVLSCLPRLPRKAVLVWTIVEGAGLQIHELCADAYEGPRWSSIGERHTVKAALDVEAGTGRDQPGAPNLYLLAADVNVSRSFSRTGWRSSKNNWCRSSWFRSVGRGVCSLPVMRPLWTSPNTRARGPNRRSVPNRYRCSR